MQPTSLESYYRLLDEGLIGERQYEVLAVILNHPGCTDRELTFWSGKEDPNYVRPRRRELERLGIIQNSGEKICTVTGRTSLTWKAVENPTIKKSREKKQKCPHCGGSGFIPSTPQEVSGHSNPT